MNLGLELSLLWSNYYGSCRYKYYYVYETYAVDIGG